MLSNSWSWRRQQIANRRRGSARHLSNASIESLERRQLLTIIGAHELEVVGRASDGYWVATGFDWDNGTVTHFDEIFAKWNPGANWTDVLHGDFDGDGLDDIIGRDPASGYWWVSLSDGVGSTTRLAGAWSNATTWSDVTVVDMPNPAVIAREGGPPSGQIADEYADLVGRAADGTWWAALSNGDGTFTNRYLASWNPAADWRDVMVSGSGMIGRASDGNWWSTTATFASDGTASYASKNFAMWNEAAGWRDVMYVPQFVHTTGTQSIPINYSAIVGRTSTGQWWAMRSDKGNVPEYVGSWNEAAGWRDVGVLQDSYFQGDAIVGRTSTGQWYRSMFTGGALVSDLIGQWDESAGWRNVQTVTFETENSVFTTPNGILGQDAAGNWQLLTRRFTGTSSFANAQLGLVSGSAGWKDVKVGEFTRGGVAYGYRASLGTGQPYFYETKSFEVSIYAQRTGVIVRIDDWTTAVNRYTIAYEVPAKGISRAEVVSIPGTVIFSGHLGDDHFVNRSRHVVVRATGRAGDDLLDSKNGKDFDQLFGGPGLDVLLGDPGDTLTQ